MNIINNNIIIIVIIVIIIILIIVIILIIIIINNISICPQNGPRKFPERRFDYSLVPNSKMVPGGLQRILLKHFCRQGAKWSQETSRGPLWSISGAKPQNGPRRFPEGRFGAFLAPDRKMVPGGLQRIVLELASAPRQQIEPTNYICLMT